MYSDIFRHLVTTADRTQFLNRLGELERIQYQNVETPLPQKINECFASEAQAIVDIVAKEGEGVLKVLAQEVAKLPVCKLTVAFDPVRTQVVKIRDTISTNVGSPLLLEISVDPRIVGGAVISWNGTYFDGSAGRKVHEYFTKEIYGQI